MSVPSLTSSAASTTTSSTTSSSSSGLNTDDFLSLLVSQLQNQNPLDPTNTDQLLNQMVSYASYSQQADTSATLTSISTTLDAIASSLNITV
jgi:flagellar basal-body rod modification protein FlgD